MISIIFKVENSILNTLLHTRKLFSINAQTIWIASFFCWIFWSKYLVSIIFEFKNDQYGLFHYFKSLNWSSHFSSNSLGSIWIQFSLINSSDWFLVKLHMNSAMHSEIHLIAFCFCSCQHSKGLLKCFRKNMIYGTSLEVPGMVPWCCLQLTCSMLQQSYHPNSTCLHM